MALIPPPARSPIYRTDYLRRGGKAIDRLDWSAAAGIEPKRGAVPLDRLTKRRVAEFHEKIAETPPRLGTKLGAPQKRRSSPGINGQLRRGKQGLIALGDAGTSAGPRGTNTAR